MYAAVVIDAVLTDLQVGNQPRYAAIEVDLDGRRDALGVGPARCQQGCDEAKFRMSVLANLKNRGGLDGFDVVSDGLNGLPGTANRWSRQQP